MTKKLFALGLVYVSLVAALSACKSEGSGGSGGGTGGTSPIDGTGGCGQCWPQCFLDMFADCMPSSTCTEQKSSAGTSVNVNQCFDNGVKMTSDTDLSTFAATMTYYKSDGSVCFATTNAFSGASVTATYKDANGSVILTDTTPVSGSGVQTIECGGKTYEVDPNSAACKSCQTGGTGTTCTAGTCTVP